MPDQKQIWTRCLGGFSVMWVTKLLISPVKKGFFAQKRPNLARNWHFWPLLAHLVPSWWVGWWLWRTGCISQEAYLLYLSIHLWWECVLHWSLLKWWTSYYTDIMLIRSEDKLKCLGNIKFCLGDAQISVTFEEISVICCHFSLFSATLSFSRKFRHFLGPGPNFSSGLMPIQQNKIVGVFFSKHFIPVIPLTLYLLCFTKILIFQILNSERG